MSSWPITTTTLKRINNNCIKNEPIQTTKEKRRKKRKQLPTANPLRLRIRLTPCSLLGRNSNHASANCVNAQLRNAQLPSNIVSIYTCAKCCVSCVCACRFACEFVREFVFLQHLCFTGESRVLGNYPASKDTEQIQNEVSSSYIV